MARLTVVRHLGILFALASAIQADTSNCQAIQPSFPSNFKCSSSEQCISTDRASTAICCNAGSNCTSIAPITCDIQQQNASAGDASTSQLFTTRLGDTLPACGANTCCPFGFACTNPTSQSPFCSMIIAQSSLNNTQSSASSFSSTTATGSATSSSSPTSTNTIDSKTPVKKKNSFPPAVFIAGVVVGIAIGILASLTWVVCTGRHNKGDTPQPSRSSSSSKRPIISAPIPFPNNSRTDFIRRAANKTRSVFSTRADDRTAQDSTGWNVKMPTPPIPDSDQGALFTPTAQHTARRKPSMETIQVYSPPGLIQYPSAVVPPLRTMSRQRQAPQRGLDHPFQTPPKMAQTGLGPNGTGEGETLMMSRYSGVDDNDLDDKRGTTFTTMMAQCRIPDRGDQFPVPKIPAPYETKYMI